MVDIENQETDIKSTESAPAATAGIDTGGAATPPADSQETSVPLAGGPPVEFTLSGDAAQSGETIEPQPVKRGRGRPRKDETAARLNSVTPPPPKPEANSAPAAVPIQAANYDALGAMAANLFFNTGELMLGDDWAPEPNEPMIVKNAFRDYFQSENIATISPAWILGITLFSYTAKRVTKPTIKTRIFGAYAWLKNKLPFKR